ncbi:fibropellin-1-like [Drosophila serrata]|uniref:fibropellin-1-like n=1 Tax=Drosophila serrata TaxID=7274 RepID=UPI000A1CFD9E|nr:fibropellin-1-like [Drosophila serrata]
MLRARHGVIQTPNFPHRFGTPIECVWIIDASDLPSTGQNVSIVVYLTQLYVLSGLKFTEYMYYSDDFKVPAHRVFTLTEDDVTQATWVQFHSQYLEIRFTMATLDGTHLRALDRLLDVYGFNITYEVQNEVKTSQCNALQCRFLGDCFASADYSLYGCACFPGFSGSDCGHGPLCQDLHTNVCQNGGTCKHIGDAAITCHCPKGFKGTRCEIPEINETTQGCTSNTSSIDCHQACDFDSFSRIGSMPPGQRYSAVKTNRNLARSGKTRYEVTMRLGANLTGYYRHADRDQLSAYGETEQLLSRNIFFI